MRRIALFLALCLAATALFSQEDGVWFQDIRTPLKSDEATLLSFTSALRQGLLDKKPIRELEKLCPIQDAKPRALFLTLGDGIFPGRTYFAVGKNFAEAFHLLLEYTAKREPEYAEAVKATLGGQIDLAKEEKRLLPDSVKIKLQSPNRWNSLRLDVVQAVLPVKGFVIKSSRLLLSSVVGIAFDRTAAFAFTPEELTGRCLLTEDRQFSVQGVGNLITEANLWSSLNLWLKMAEADAYFNVNLFETDSYYADENGCVRLFRAHPVRLNAEPSPEKVIALAETAATLLNPGKGTIRAPFLEWVVGRSTEKTALFDQAALVRELLDASQYAADDRKKALLEAAKLAAEPLLDAVKHVDPHEKVEQGLLVTKGRRKPEERAYAMLVEGEDNPYASEFEVPARISELRANALAYLAFADLRDCLPESDEVRLRCQKELPQLFRHIASQVNDDGTCFAASGYPNREIRLVLVKDTPLTEADSLETAAIAGLAMERHRAAYPQDDTEELRLFLPTLRDSLGQRSTEHLEEKLFSPYLVQFLGMDARQDNPQRLAQLTRLATSAVHDLTLAPALPDMFGCDTDIPSMTYAAERLATVAVVAAVLAQAGSETDALSLLMDAWPLWVFMQQADMDSAATSVLPQPRKYLGFQRDNLADYGFTLNGQTTHILAQSLLLQAMQSLQLSDFPPPEEMLDAWRKAWTHLDQHPICLDSGLVLKGIAKDPRQQFANQQKTEKQGSSNKKVLNRKPSKKKSKK